MSDLELRDIQTLADLQSALGRFASGTAEGLRTAQDEISRVDEWLRERTDRWQRDTDRARREVAQATANLGRCEASGYRDDDGHYHQPDCSSEARALASAEAHLRECDQHLRTAQAWRSRVTQAISEYQHEARRLEDLAVNHTEKAKAVLAEMLTKYEKVKAAQTIGHGVVGIGSLKPNRYGTLGHTVIEHSVEETASGEVGTEVSVRITKPDGSEGIGRIDTMAEGAIIDYKFYDLDHPSDAALRRTMKNMADKMHRYGQSPDVPPDSSLILVFASPPADLNRRSLIEQYFTAEGIQVKWGGT